jgi:hypothetical protein
MKRPLALPSPLVRALALLLVLLAGGCRQERPPPEADGEAASLLGRWRLDAETREWVPRACVVLTVDDLENAAIEIAQEGGQAVVRLLGTPPTPFTGSLRDRTFDGRQILPTSETGRFCGRETAVILRLRLERGDPDGLRGTWQTPDCGVCPDRPFGATRVGA